MSGNAGEHSVQPQLPCRELRDLFIYILIIDDDLQLP